MRQGMREEMRARMLGMVTVLALWGMLQGCRAEPPVLGSDSPSPRAPAAGNGPSAEGTLRVTFLDVGQGDAALVQAPGGVCLLVDGGPPEAGPKVLKAVKDAGLFRLTWLMGSHPHSDHIGGLLDVLPEVSAEQALDPGYNHGTSTQQSYLKLLKQGGTRVTRARAGQTHDLGSGARLEILAPEEPLLERTASDANNNSIVARLVFGETRLLFTGDMEEPQRERLLKSRYRERLKAEVLKVAHHGSHNGTDVPFLQAVAPRYAVISSEKGNEYGHPHREALRDLGEQKIPVLRTDQRGDIVFTTDGKTLKLEGAPPGETTPGPAAAPARKGEVVGNRTSKVYHAPGCASLPAKERRVSFESAAEAEKAGYRKHGKCVDAD